MKKQSKQDIPKYTAWCCKDCNLTIYKATDNDIAEHINSDLHKQNKQD